jgi:hypothetical protein
MTGNEANEPDRLQSGLEFSGRKMKKSLKTPSNQTNFF